MSAEQLAAARKAGEEIPPEVRAQWKRFHARLGALRTTNKDLSNLQREARLQGKPSKGRVHKSKFVALKITIILNMMREMKGLITFYLPVYVCKDPKCGHATTGKPRPIHNIRGEDRTAARKIREELKLLLDLDEFIADNKDK